MSDYFDNPPITQGIYMFLMNNHIMNWYVTAKAKRKYKDERREGDKMDAQRLCCGYPENRRKDPYKKNESKNYPKTPEN